MSYQGAPVNYTNPSQSQSQRPSNSQKLPFNGAIDAYQPARPSSTVAPPSATNDPYANYGYGDPATSGYRRQQSRQPHAMTPQPLNSHHQRVPSHSPPSSSVGPPQGPPLYAQQPPMYAPAGSMQTHMPMQGMQRPPFGPPPMQQMAMSPPMQNQQARDFGNPRMMMQMNEYQPRPEPYHPSGPFPSQPPGPPFQQQPQPFRPPFNPEDQFRPPFNPQEHFGPPFEGPFRPPMFDEPPYPGPHGFDGPPPFMDGPPQFSPPRQPFRGNMSSGKRYMDDRGPMNRDSRGSDPPDRDFKRQRMGDRDREPRGDDRYGPQRFQNRDNAPRGRQHHRGGYNGPRNQPSPNFRGGSGISNRFNNDRRPQHRSQGPPYRGRGGYQNSNAGRDSQTTSQRQRGLVRQDKFTSGYDKERKCSYFYSDGFLRNPWEELERELGLKSELGKLIDGQSSGDISVPVGDNVVKTDEVPSTEMHIVSELDEVRDVTEGHEVKTDQETPVVTDGGDAGDNVANEDEETNSASVERKELVVKDGNVSDVFDQTESEQADVPESAHGTCLESETAEKRHDTDLNTIDNNNAEKQEG